MSVTALLTELRERGIQLEARGDRLRYAPREAVPEELRAKIVEHKSALLQLLTERPQPCPKCGAGLKVEAGDSWRHFWCDSCRFDRWEATRPGGLSGAFGMPTGRELVAGALNHHHCPGCGQSLVLQDRARDAWFCPGCRLWAVEGVIQ